MGGNRRFITNHFKVHTYLELIVITMRVTMYVGTYMMSILNGYYSYIFAWNSVRSMVGIRNTADADRICKSPLG